MESAGNQGIYFQANHHPVQLVENLFEAGLCPVGVVRKTTGYQGKVLADPYAGYEETWKSLSKCLIRVNGVWAPFFVLQMEERNDGIEVLFDDLRDDKEAKSIVNEEIFIQPQDILNNESPEEEEDDMAAWIGFTVSDQATGFAGQIEDIEEMPTQLLAHIRSGDKEYAIPLVEELIEDIDIKNRTIIMNLPPGLLDL